MFLTAAHLDKLPISRYEFLVRARVDAELPPFLGSTLRGAFGHALKAVACSMLHGDCKRCLVVERCLYPRLFEKVAMDGARICRRSDVPQGAVAIDKHQNQRLRRGSTGQSERLLWGNQDAPRPFIFLPPLVNTSTGFMSARDDMLRWRVRVQADDTVVFGLSLLGDAMLDLPYVIYAVKLMAEHGFGANRVAFDLDSVAALDDEGNREIVYTQDMDRVLPHGRTTVGALSQARLAQLASKASSRRRPALGNGTEESKGLYGSVRQNGSSSSIDKLKLRFITPTRLRVKGRAIENPTFAQFVTSLSLRITMLAEAYAKAPISYDYRAMHDRASTVSSHNSSLRLMALDRFSSRRQCKLALDGFVGEVTFRGQAVEDLLPLIVAGEFLHLGSGTAFGLGRYSILP